MISEFIGTKQQHNKLFSEKLARIMKEKNIGISDLAKLTYKNKQTISEYLRGNKNPSSYFIRELAHGLSIPHHELNDF